MRLENRLFRRGGGYEYVDELSTAARERLLGRARSLNREEEEVQRLLGLPYPPRLCLVDEETASLISAGELRRLREETEGGATGGR